MKALNNVRTFFNKKFNNQKTATAPEGICPNCWGKQEWEGDFYTKIKAKNITPENKIYSRFIKDVTSKLDKITLKQDTLICETCNSK